MIDRIERTAPADRFDEAAWIDYTRYLERRYWLSGGPRRQIEARLMVDPATGYAIYFRADVTRPNLDPP